MSFPVRILGLGSALATGHSGSRLSVKSRKRRLATRHADPELFAARVQVPLEISCSCDKTFDGAGPRIMARSRLCITVPLDDA